MEEVEYASEVLHMYTKIQIERKRKLIRKVKKIGGNMHYITPYACQSQMHINTSFCLWLVVLIIYTEWHMEVRDKICALLLFSRVGFSHHEARVALRSLGELHYVCTYNTGGGGGGGHGNT